MSDTKSKPTLAYWGIRGLAQPIRLLLKYNGEDFVDKKYHLNDGPNYECPEYKKEKYTLGLDFPNLPYYIDGDVKVTQSNAILRYIGRKFDMCGKTEAERVRVDMMENQVMDLRNGFVRLAYNAKDYDNQLPGYLEALPAKLEAFDKFLGDHPYFAGDNITFPDFHMYEMLDQHLQLKADCLDAFQKLAAFVKRFEAIPQIKAYMESEDFMKAPLNNKMAAFGAK